MKNYYKTYQIFCFPHTEWELWIYSVVKAKNKEFKFHMYHQFLEIKNWTSNRNKK